MSVRKLAHDITLRMAEQSAGAAARLRRQGMQMPSKPLVDTAPSVPADITEMDDQSLMAIYTELISWADYLGMQLAMAQIDEKHAESVQAVAEAKVLSKGWSGKATDRVAVAKAEMALDPAVQRAQQDYLDAYAYRKLVEVLFVNVERDAAAVSRELTRRTSVMPKHRDRWST